MPSSPILTPETSKPSLTSDDAPLSTTLSGSSRIQLLDVMPGKAASFLTQAGKRLTVVASAASYSPPTPSFRLSVGPNEGKAAYETASVAAPSEPVTMPYSQRFTETNAAMLNAIRAAENAAPGMRRLEGVPEARTIGSQDAFWINNGSSTSDGDLQRTCTLKRITDHAYFYVDNEAPSVTQANMEQLATEFESKIYPRVTSAFGEEAKPGVDGDNRLFIVLSPAVNNWGKEKGLMGYFWSRDAIPARSSGSHSNQKECLFMTDTLFSYPELTSYGTLAHEFQHLINFSQKAVRSNYSMAEETWLDEGLAMYAMEVAGYGLPAGDKNIAKDLNEFQQNPAAYSLTDWTSNPHGFSYGQSYLFVRYMVDRFGPSVIKEVLQSPKAGQAGLEPVLASHQSSFASFFRDWTITNLISGQSVANGTPYQYQNLDLAGNYGGFQLEGFKTTPATSTNVTAGLRPWGTAYYTFDSAQQKTWQFNLGETGAIRLLGAAIVP